MKRAWGEVRAWSWLALLAKEGDAVSVDSIDLDFSGAKSADPRPKKKDSSGSPAV